MSVRVRRVLLVGLVAVGVLAAVAWAFWPRPIAVATAPVVRGELRAWVEEQAVTRVPQVYRITMPIDGRVLPTELVEGSEIRQGQVVARVEPDDLQSAIDAAEARLEQVDARLTEARDVRLELTALDQINEFLVSLDRTVEAAEARTRASEARRDFAADQLRRAETAHAAGAMAEAELDQRRLESVEAETSLRADLLALRATMATREAARIGPRFIHEYIEQRMHRREQLQQDRRQAEAELERLKRDLLRTHLTSPIDGVVFARAVTDERVVAAGALVMEIGRLQDLEVEAEVLSEEVVRIAPGAAAQVFGGAVGEVPVEAVVARIHPQGFTKISALGIEQQRVLVVLRFAPGEVEALRERGRVLGSDFRVRVRILVDEREEALRVPRTAVFRGVDGEWQAFVVRAGRAELARLRVGLMTPNQVEVLEGAGDADRVVLSPPAELSHGSRVRDSAWRD